MRRKDAILLALLVMLPLAGCGRPHEHCVSVRELVSGPPGNLLLGNDPEQTWAALDQRPRDEWPAFATGYRLDEQVFYDVSIYDEQSYFDEFGSLYQTNVSVRTGVFLPR